MSPLRRCRAALGHAGSAIDDKKDRATERSVALSTLEVVLECNLEEPGIRSEVA